MRETSFDIVFANLENGRSVDSKMMILGKLSTSKVHVEVILER